MLKICFIFLVVLSLLGFRNAWISSFSIFSWVVLYSFCLACIASCLTISSAVGAIGIISGVTLSPVLVPVKLYKAALTPSLSFVRTGAGLVNLCVPFQNSYIVPSADSTTSPPSRNFSLSFISSMLIVDALTISLITLWVVISGIVVLLPLLLGVFLTLYCLAHSSTSPTTLLVKIPAITFLPDLPFSISSCKAIAFLTLR